MSRVERLLERAQLNAAGLATSVDARGAWSAALSRALDELALEIAPAGSLVHVMARRSVRARRGARRAKSNVIDFAAAAARLAAKKEGL